jgi:hypothetical protein
MKTHSAEWFNAKIEETRKHIKEQWPDWMKETSVVATASFPKLGGNVDAGQVTPRAHVGAESAPLVD